MHVMAHIDVSLSCDHLAILPTGQPESPPHGIPQSMISLAIHAVQRTTAAVVCECKRAGQ